MEQSMHGNMFSDKSEVAGRWLAIMDHVRNDRGLFLSSFRTRCVRSGEIHEFLLCPADAERAERIDSLSYLGFGEIDSAGVIEVGDSVYLGRMFVGHVLGFDDTHAPNHYNVVIRGPRSCTGQSLGLSVGDRFSVRSPSSTHIPVATETRSRTISMAEMAEGAD
jgi:Family of unknown function (DUF6917)